MLGDLDAEIPLYERAGELLAFLGKREYPAGVSGLFEAYKDFYEYGLIEEGDMKLVTAWIQDIIELELFDAGGVVERTGMQGAVQKDARESRKLDQARDDDRHGAESKAYLLKSVDNRRSG